MANDLNQCNFIGRLGQDPEIRYTANGKAVANISLAVGESWKDQQGQKQERTEWVRATAFGPLAEVIGKYLTKGSQAFIHGKMVTRKWTDQQGQDRYSTEINIQNLQMLGGGQQNGQPQQRQHPQGQQPAHQNQPQSQSQQHAQPTPSQGEPDFPMDDDMPFASIGLQFNNQFIHCM